MPDSMFFMRLLITAPPLLLSLTIHEFAHARTALAFGDPTARDNGRVTLNPLAHLDPIGTLCILFSGMIGWAKPVPVNVANLSPRGLGNFSVSLAGPGSNLCLAVLAGIALKVSLSFCGHQGPEGLPALPALPESMFARVALAMLLSLLMANICLCVFNLIPLFPLDGSHILQEMLPLHLHHRYIYWQMHYGMIALMGIIFGPRLLGNFGIHIFDPFGWLYGLAFSIAVEVLQFSNDSLYLLGDLLRMIYPG